MVFLRQQRPITKGVAWMSEPNDRLLSLLIGLADSDQAIFNQIEALAWIALYKDSLSCFVGSANGIAIE